MPTFQTDCPNTNQSPGLFPAQANGNWLVLQDEINRDHVFNDTPNAIPSTDNSGTHRQVTLTDRLDPVALPAGTNGIIYLKDGKVSYFNGTSLFQLAPVRASVIFNGAGVIQGTAFNATVGVAANVYTVTFTVPLPSINCQFFITGTDLDLNNLCQAVIQSFTVNAISFKFKNQNASTIESTSMQYGNLMMFGG